MVKTLFRAKELPTTAKKTLKRKSPLKFNLIIVNKVLLSYNDYVSEKVKGYARVRVPPNELSLPMERYFTLFLSSNNIRTVT